MTFSQSLFLQSSRLLEVTWIAFCPGGEVQVLVSSWSPFVGWAGVGQVGAVPTAVVSRNLQTCFLEFHEMDCFPYFMGNRSKPGEGRSTAQDSVRGSRVCDMFVFN